MSEIPTQGQSIIVDPETGEIATPRVQPGQGLVSWLVGTVGPWRDHRNFNHLDTWAEYWRMWRGQWDRADANRMSERSRLIAPALAQAIEMSVAEVEESMLSRAVWFDVIDDLEDSEKLDATLMRDRLLEDLDSVHAKDVVSEAVLNSAIFGTGCVKVSTDVVKEKVPARDMHGSFTAEVEERVSIRLDSYRPDQIIPDPAAATVQDMQGIALETVVPTHAVLEKISKGIYRAEAARFLGGAPLPRENRGDFSRESLLATDTNHVEVVEYHGKVPKSLLEAAMGDRDAALPVDAILNVEPVEGDQMIEAIITYANDNVLLRAMPNPFTMTDRSVICFSWEKVPSRFWGRGVSEKGYNPQKALDAEMRARADALGFLSSPMLGIDGGRIPRGFKPEVKPGKVWLTNGPPQEILQPVVIGGLEPSTFNQTAELTQMVQMGTGAFDTATTLRGSTSTGGNAANAGSMMMGAFVKRAKRAIQNVDRNLLSPLVQKVAWRYLQFDPDRYPFDDHKFKITATLGIVAREIEQVNLTQLIGMLPEQGVSSRLAAAEGFVDLSSVLNKADIIQAIDQDKQLAAQQQQQMQQMEEEKHREEMELLQLSKETETLKNQKVIAEIRKLLAEAVSEEREADVKELQALLEQQRVRQEARQIEQFDRQNDIADRRLDIQERALVHKMKTDNSGS